jgi:hypothetical protein
MSWYKFQIPKHSNITLADLHECSTYFKKEDFDNMNKVMQDVLNTINFGDITYKERLLMEDIFKKGYIAAHIKVSEHD